MNHEPEKGTALLVTISLLFLITLLGFSAWRWANEEVGISANQAAAVRAQYIAEAGVAVMLQWFQEPKTFPEQGTFPGGYPAGERSSFLERRMTDSRGATSFFDGEGRSQFTGTGEVPDFEYQDHSQDGGLLGETFADLGVLHSLKLFGPTTPGAIGTVEATGATRSGMLRTVSVEMIPGPVPPTTAAVQIGEPANAKVPLLVHWGDLQVMGNADLGDSLERIPRKDSQAPADGQPYSLDVDRRDAWIDFYAGGSIINPETTACPDCTEPFWQEGYGHLHQFQTRVRPDFGLDSWDYQRLKDFSRAWGTYYATDQNGFLYRDGVMDYDHRTTSAQALSPEAVGDHRGFVFIDTVDQKPPDGTNLTTLELPADYLEGLFFIQAHVVLRESGPGRFLPVQSPPAEGTADPSTRQSTILSNVHLNGVLAVAGQLTVEGHPNVYGALMTQQGFSGSGEPEIWYDADLGTGYYSDLPTVTILKGSWYIR
jgi:hypothetical protein